MTLSELLIYLLKFCIPAAFSILFRAVAFGYTTKRRVALGFGVYAVYVLLVPALLMTLMGYGEYTHIASPVMLAGSMAVLIFSSDTPGKTIFLQLAQSGMLTAMSVLANMARTLIGFSYSALLVVLTVCSALLFWVGLRFWAKPMRFLVDHIQDGMGSLLLLPLLTMAVVSLIPVYPPKNFANHPIFCTLIILMVETVLFLHLYTMYRNLRRISALSQENLRSELLSQEIVSYQTYLEAAKQNRHDLRHHDALLLEYLERGDVASAMKYLRAHSDGMAKEVLRQFSADPTVNAVLRIYARRSEEAGVRFSAVSETPALTMLDAPKLGGLLSNLLENALHAAKEAANGSIAFEARVEDDNLLIELRNSVACKTTFHNGLPLSRKPEGGTGVRSVMSVIRACGGLADFSQENDEFRSRVLLPLKR